MELINVDKHFKEKKVLHAVNINLDKGEVVGLIGKNGAGKTTIMKILCENIKNFDGKFIKDDESTTGYLIENPKFYPNKSGIYNLHYLSLIYGNKIDDRYLNEIINNLDMKDYINNKVSTYSLGMKQRLGIAISLLNKPNFLILDEPTNGMDPDGSIEVLQMLKNLSKKMNIGMLISSHKLEDIELVGDRVVFIHKGRVENNVSLNDLKQKNVITITLRENQIDRAFSFLSNNGVLSKKHNSTLTITEITDTEEILKLLSKIDIYPQNITNNTASLKDYYLNVTAKNKEEAS